jgi:hypothetical protein
VPPGICHRWLPVWLPAISLGWLMFERSNVVSTPRQACGAHVWEQLPPQLGNRVIVNRGVSDQAIRLGEDPLRDASDIARRLQCGRKWGISSRTESSASMRLPAGIPIGSRMRCGLAVLG